MFNLEKYNFKEAAITTAAISVGVSGYMAYDSSQKKKKAQNEMNNYERQSLDNAFKNVQISTLGSDLMREENQRTTANLLDASKDAGVRGIMGAIPKILAQNNDIIKKRKWRWIIKLLNVIMLLLAITKS